MPDGTPFHRFAGTCRDLRDLEGRNDKRDRAARLLSEVIPEERAATARFLAGEVLSPRDERDLGIGPSTLREVAGGSQATLFGGPVTIGEAADVLDRLAGLGGSGSRDRRRTLLSGLLGRLDEGSRGWLERVILGELRTGVQEGLVLEAVAEAADVDPGLVHRAHQLLGDVGEVAEVALGDGAGGLEAVELVVGRPIAPMLAEKADTIEEAVDDLDPPVAVEPKYDGARVQIHRDGDDVRVFSRRLTDVTDSLPEAVDVGGALDADRAVVVGEVVAYDDEGHPRPFQDLMRRFRREHDRNAQAARMPVQVHLFDGLYLDGESLIDRPFEDRRAALKRIADEDACTPLTVTSSLAEARSVLEQALQDGHEGVVVKRLSSRYEPGRRGASWRKVKPETTLDLVVLGAERGHGRREGWLSNLHLGVRVPEDQRDRLVQPRETPSGPVTRREGYAMVGKTFKGMTDEQLERITELLKERADREEDWGIVARPDLVVEVAFDEVQDSPHYESGYALRFARVKALREDKPVDEAATLEDVIRVRQGEGAG